MHHIVSDGWSIGVLIREVAALYDAFRAGRPSPLPELAIQYADYRRLAARVAPGRCPEEPARLLDGPLAGVPPLELPTDRPRPAGD